MAAAGGQGDGAGIGGSGCVSRSLSSSSSSDKFVVDIVDRSIFNSVNNVGVDGDVDGTITNDGGGGVGGGIIITLCRGGRPAALCLPG